MNRASWCRPMDPCRTQKVWSSTDASGSIDGTSDWNANPLQTRSRSEGPTKAADLSPCPGQPTLLGSMTQGSNSIGARGIPMGSHLQIPQVRFSNEVASEAKRRGPRRNRCSTRKSRPGPEAATRLGCPGPPGLRTTGTGWARIGRRPRWGTRLS